jgi:hypothetical protein
MAIDKWRSYLLRGPFTSKTGQGNECAQRPLSSSTSAHPLLHKSLCHLNDQSLTSELQKKAMTKLIGLQYKFQYKKGSDNKPADALSRVAHNMQLQALSVVQPVWMQEVIHSYAVDPHAQGLLQELAISAQGLTLQDGIIRHHDKVWIGANVGLQTQIISAFHASAMGGHSGAQATYQRLQNLFHWKGLKVDVETFVKQCAVCQQAKHELCPLDYFNPYPSLKAHGKILQWIS